VQDRPPGSALTRSGVSVFSSVDSSGDPDRVIRYLDQTAIAAFRMKHYAMAAHALRRPEGFVVDVGCGAGHDLDLLGSAGIRPLGVDPSAILLRVAGERTDRTVPLVQAQGEALPFADSSLAGCRIERVLIHVREPAAVVKEIARCLRPGALLSAFEPDWDSFTVRSAGGDEHCGWICGVRHPGVGSELWNLMEAAGCEVLDRVEELSIWKRLAVLDRVIELAPSIEKAVIAQRISRARADEWLTEQRERDGRGVFRAAMPKILIVARKR
jgi:SAM-dependent methyltransferase